MYSVKSKKEKVHINKKSELYIDIMTQSGCCPTYYYKLN